MKISTKVEYGIVALIDIAINTGANGVVTVISIAARNNISKNYLEQVLTPLRQAGIISGTKGSQGGYILLEKPELLKVSTILNALDSTLLAVSAETGTKCDENIKRAINVILWDKLDSAFTSIASNITLADLVEEYKNGSNLAAMFYI